MKIDQHLRPIDMDGKPISNVFAIGDNATPSNGNRLPATAQGTSLPMLFSKQLLTTLLSVASQMASHLSKSLNAIGKGANIEQTTGFAWKNRGSMVFIGDERVGALPGCIELAPEFRPRC